MPRPSLSSISTAALKNEIKRRTRNLNSLKAKRDALDKQIAELEGAAGWAMKKSGRKPGRKPRAKRAAGKPLAEYIRDTLAKAPKGLRVTEIAKAVLAAGYQTKAKNVYKPVTKVLARDEFKRLDRGVYGLKGTAKAAKRVSKKAATKPKAAPAAPAAEKAEAQDKRHKYAQTGEEFIMDLFSGKESMTVGEIIDAWVKAGRGGKPDNYLTKLVKDGKLKRISVEGQRASRYSLA